MAVVDVSNRQLQEPLIRWLALVIIVPNVAIFPAVFLDWASELWHEPGAVWLGEAGLQTLVCGVVCTAEALFAMLLLYLWFGGQAVRVSGAGVLCEKKFMGVVWKRTFFPAASISAWMWGRNFLTTVCNRPCVSRKETTYEC